MANYKGSVSCLEPNFDDNNTINTRPFKVILVPKSKVSKPSASFMKKAKPNKHSKQEKNSNLWGHTKLFENGIDGMVLGNNFHLFGLILSFSLSTRMYLSLSLPSSFGQRKWTLCQMKKGVEQIFFVIGKWEGGWSVGR